MPLKAKNDLARSARSCVHSKPLVVFRFDDEKWLPARSNLAQASQILTHRLRLAAAFQPFEAEKSHIDHCEGSC